MVKSKTDPGDLWLTAPLSVPIVTTIFSYKQMGVIQPDGYGFCTCEIRWLKLACRFGAVILPRFFQHPHLWLVQGVCEDGIRACTAWRNVASEWPFPVLKSFFFSDNEPLPVWPNILGRQTSWMNRKPGPEWRKKWKWQFEWCSDKPTVESIYYPLIAFYL